MGLTQAIMLFNGTLTATILVVSVYIAARAYLWNDKQKRRTAP